ncbi:MAG: hypothetical protein JXR91_12810 [Deltaproteobacteria bacterium]|nr:hypothetical protein [Deltaproteobacteria bacterium]
MKIKKAGLFHFVLLSLLSLYLLSCAPADEDRCDDGQIFENESCITIADSEPVTSSDSESDILDGSLGSICKSDNDCNSDVPKCLMQPGKTEGYCTMNNCNFENNDCPKGYSCCELSGESDCLNNDDYNLMKTIGICK